jgi:hypothetical protein
MLFGTTLQQFPEHSQSINIRNNAASHITNGKHDCIAANEL